MTTNQDFARELKYVKTYVLPISPRINTNDLDMAITVETIESFFDGLVEVLIQEANGILILTIKYPLMALWGVELKFDASNGTSIKSCFPKLNYFPSERLRENFIDLNVMNDITSALWAMKLYTTFDFGGIDVFSKQTLDELFEDILNIVQGRYRDVSYVVITQQTNELFMRSITGLNRKESYD